MMMMNAKYCKFLARFVDAVTTEALASELVRLRRTRLLIEQAYPAAAAYEYEPEFEVPESVAA